MCVHRMYTCTHTCMHAQTYRLLPPYMSICVYWKYSQLISSLPLSRGSGLKSDGGFLGINRDELCVNSFLGSRLTFLLKGSGMASWLGEWPPGAPPTGGWRWGGRRWWLTRGLLKLPGGAEGLGKGSLPGEGCGCMGKEERKGERRGERGNKREEKGKRGEKEKAHNL